jgi:purine-binding chemotaxis protein CheW
LDGQSVLSGIIVDSVEKVLIFEPEQINPELTESNGFNSDYIHGIATLNDEFVVFLNIEKIFSEEEISLRKTV